MDDHELSARLDSSVRAAPASDEALSRIHRRARQRTRRVLVASTTLAVVLVATGGATVAALFSTGDHDRPIRPAAPTSAAPAPAAADTSAPCPRKSITLAIQILHDARGSSAAAEALPWWVVTGATKTRAQCQIKSVLDAAIEGSDGTLLGTIPGNPAQDTLQAQLIPEGSIVVGTISWTDPCTAMPVRIVLRFHDTGDMPAAVLNLPKQPCGHSSTSASHFSVNFDLYGPTTVRP